MIESARRADAPRQVDREQIATFVHPAAELLERLVPIERDHVGASVLAPMTGALIHEIVHFVDAYGRAIGVHLAAILGVQVHEGRLIAAYVRLRLEELRSTCDVPATVARVRSVAVADTGVYQAGWLTVLNKSLKKN